MKTLLYANRAEPKSISVISILMLAAVGDITKLRYMHRECYIFASKNLCLYYVTYLPSSLSLLPSTLVLAICVSSTNLVLLLPL